MRWALNTEDFVVDLSTEMVDLKHKGEQNTGWALNTEDFVVDLSTEVVDLKHRGAMLCGERYTKKRGHICSGP
jgi:hypothetical protein